MCTYKIFQYSFIGQFQYTILSDLEYSVQVQSSGGDLRLDLRIGGTQHRPLRRHHASHELFRRAGSWRSRICGLIDLSFLLLQVFRATAIFSANMGMGYNGSIVILSLFANPL